MSPISSRRAAASGPSGDETTQEGLTDKPSGPLCVGSVLPAHGLETDLNWARISYS